MEDSEPPSKYKQLINSTYNFLNNTTIRYNSLKQRLKFDNYLAREKNFYRNLAKKESSLDNRLN